MEFKMNKEIRDYYEQFFMGLSLRNIVWSVAGIVTGLIIGFVLKGRASSETLSWVIPTAVVPFWFIGFKKIKGMPMEKFIAAWFRQTYLIPKKLVLKNDDIFGKLLKEVKEKNAKKQGKS